MAPFDGATSEPSRAPPERTMAKSAPAPSASPACAVDAQSTPASIARGRSRCDGAKPNAGPSRRPTRCKAFWNRLIETSGRSARTRLALPGDRIACERWTPVQAASGGGGGVRDHGLDGHLGEQRREAGGIEVRAFVLPHD